MSWLTAGNEADARVRCDTLQSRLFRSVSTSGSRHRSRQGDETSRDNVLQGLPRNSGD